MVDCTQLGSPKGILFGSKTVRSLRLEARFICEERLVAECGECSMKSINPLPPEVLYV